MAIAQIAITSVSDKGTPWGVVPVEDSTPFDNEYVNNPAASTQTSKAVPSGTPFHYYWSVTASGGDIWVAFGLNPTAAIASGSFLVPSGMSRAFRANPGHIAAVINGA